MSTAARSAVVRPVAPGDATAIADIYNHYVRDTIVTFEEVPITATEMQRRIDEGTGAGFPWFVAVDGGALVGYAYASSWKSRIGYRRSVEATVYLAPAACGRGLGSALYGQLLPALDAIGIHVALGGIALPNDASVALHERFGFAKVAHLREVGTKFGNWIDVGYWERIAPGSA